MADTCRSTRDFHRQMSEKLKGAGIDKVPEYLAMVEGQMLGRLEDGELKALGLRGKSLEKMKELLEKIVRDEEVGEREYLWMVEKYEEAKRRRAGRRYDFKNIGAQAMGKMIRTVDGRYRAEIAREIAVRFSEKVGQIADAVGVSREGVIRGSRGDVGEGGRVGYRALFEMVRGDMEREAGAVRQAIVVYGKWADAVERGDREAGEVLRAQLEALEKINPKLRHIGSLEIGGDIVEYGEYVKGDAERYDAKIEGLRTALRMYDATLASWEAMCDLSTSVIGTMEGVLIKRGGGIESKLMDEEEWGEDYEETPEDLFRTESEFRAAWKSMPDEVRSVLSECFAVRGRQTLYGVFGDPMRVNPRTEYQSLVLKLRTSSGSRDMTERLREYVGRHGNLEPLLNRVESDEGFRTSLFCCMKKGFQRYTQFKYEWEFGRLVMRMVDLNGRLGKRRSSRTNIMRSRKIDYKKLLIPEGMTKYSEKMRFSKEHDAWRYNREDKDKVPRWIEWEETVENAFDLEGKMLYDKSGRVDHKVAQKLAVMTDYWYWPQDIEEGSDADKMRPSREKELMKLKPFILMTSSEAIAANVINASSRSHWNEIRYNILIQSANAIGIELTDEAAENLLQDSPEGWMNLKQFVSYYRTLLGGYTDEGKPYNVLKLFATSDSEFHDKYKWVNMMTDSSLIGLWMRGDQAFDMLGKIDWVLGQVEKQKDYSLRAQAMSRGGKKRTYESAIEPSFLSEFTDQVRGSDSEAKRKWIKETWLKDEKFMRDGFIFDPFLRTLYYESLHPEDTDEWSITKTFDFTRDLGTKDKEFERMSDKEHMLQAMSAFYSEESTGYGAKKLGVVRYMSAEEFNEAYERGELGPGRRYVVSGFLDKDEKGTYKFFDEPSADDIANDVKGYKMQTVVTVENNKIVTAGTYKRPVGTYPIFIQGDSNASRYVKMPRYSKEDVVEEMYNVFQSELSRMQQVRELEATRGISIANFMKRKKGPGNGDMFTILTYLNDEVDRRMAAGEGDSRLEVIANMGKEDVKDLIRNQLEKETYEFMYSLDELGLLEVTAKKDGGRTFETYKYIDGLCQWEIGDNPEEHKAEIVSRLGEFYYNYKMAHTSMMRIFGMDPSMFSSVEDMQKRWKQIVANGEMLDLDATYKGDDTAALKDRYEHSVYVDDIKTNCEVTDPEFMAGILRYHSDPELRERVEEAIKKGITKKIFPARPDGMSDKDYKKLVDDANRDRYEEINYLLSTKSERERMKETGMFVETVRYRVRYMPYTKNTLTDGQAWRSLTSYRSIMIRRGHKWWGDKEEQAYKTIMDIRSHAKGRDLTASEIAEIEQAAACFQPLKPFTYGFEELKYVGEDEEGNLKDKTALIASQRKCSDCVLIPELLERGSKLWEIANLMEDLEEKAGSDVNAPRLDCVYSVESVKVGIHSALSLTGNEKDFANTLRQAVETHKGVHDMHWKYYRVQANMPEHMNEERRIGTQVMKIMMCDMNFKPEANYMHYFPTQRICLGKDKDGNLRYADGKMDGVQMNELYQSQFVCNIMESLAEFEQRLSTMQGISDEVVNALVSNMRSNIDNVYGFMITKDDRFILPLFEPSVAKDTAGALLSLFRGIVNKQMAHGGSAIQQSPFGLTQREYVDDGGLQCHYDEQHNCIDVDCEIAFAEEYTDADGRTVKLKFEDWNEQVDGQWELKKDENGVPLIEKEFPGILDIIAYRIPTERSYSVLKLHVKRFTPLTNGSTIKVPSQFTTVAGFDFDIDKLYMLRKSFVERAKKGVDGETVIAVAIERLKQEKGIDDGLSGAETYAALQDMQSQEIAMIEAEEDKTVERARRLALVKERNPLDYLSQMYEGKIEDSDLANLDMAIEEAMQGDGSTGYESRWEEYDYSKPPLEQSCKEVRTNMILHIMQMRLSDPETFVSRTTAGGFEGAKSSGHEMKYLTVLADDDTDPSEAYSKAKEYEEAVAQNPDNTQAVPYDFADPMTLVRFNKQNQIAAKLIGIFANESTNNIFTQLLDEFELKHGHEILLFRSKERGIGRKLVYRDNDEIKNEIDYNMAQSLAASVDAVKEAVFNYFNVNEHTANLAVLMLRTGFEYEDVGMYLQQPVIVETVNLMARNGWTVDKAAQEVWKRHFAPAKIGSSRVSTGNELQLESAASDILRYKQAKDADKQEFVDNLRAFMEGADKRGVGFEGDRGTHVASLMKTDSDFRERQKKHLSMFLDLMESAQQLSDHVMTTKYTASNTIGSTPGAIYSAKNKTENNNVPENFTIRYNREGSDGTFKDGETITFSKEMADGTNIDELLETKGKDAETIKKDRERYLAWLMQTPYMIEQMMVNGLGMTMRKIFSKVNPYETDRYQTMLRMASSISNGGTIGKDLTDKLFEEHLLWELRQYALFNFDRKIRVIDSGREIEITYGDYLHNDFVKAYEKFLSKYDEETSRYQLFTDAVVQGMDSNNIHSTKTHTLRLADIVTDDRNRDQLKSEILDILRKASIKGEYPGKEFYVEAKNMILHLYAYGVMMGGFGENTQNFMRIMPTDFYQGLIVSGSLDEGTAVHYNELLESQLEDSGMEEEDVERDERDYITAFAVKNLNISGALVKYIDEREKFRLKNDGSLPDSHVLRGEDEKASVAKKKEVDKNGRVRYFMPPVIVVGTSYNPEAIFVLDSSNFYSSDFSVTSTSEVVYRQLKDEYGGKVKPAMLNSGANVRYSLEHGWVVNQRNESFVEQNLSNDENPTVDMETIGLSEGSDEQDVQPDNPKVNDNIDMANDALADAAARGLDVSDMELPRQAESDKDAELEKMVQEMSDKEVLNDGQPVCKAD